MSKVLFPFPCSSFKFSYPSNMYVSPCSICVNPCKLLSLIVSACFRFLFLILICSCPSGTLCSSSCFYICRFQDGFKLLIHPVHLCGVFLFFISSLFSMFIPSTAAHSQLLLTVNFFSLNFRILCPSVLPFWLILRPASIS